MQSINMDLDYCDGCVDNNEKKACRNNCVVLVRNYEHKLCSSGWIRKHFFTISSIAGFAILAIFTLMGVVINRSVEQVCSNEVKFCPKYDLMYHIESGKCFREGESPEGICGRHMVMTPEYSCWRQGYCECDYDNHDRWLVYHNESNQCHFLYTQGYCQPGEWLEIIGSLVVCTASICAQQIENDPDGDGEMNWVPYNGKCYKLYSKEVEGCDEEELRFYKGSFKPVCHNPLATAAGMGSGGVGALPPGDFKCPPGSVRGVNGQCLPTVVMDE